MRRGSVAQCLSVHTHPRPDVHKKNPEISFISESVKRWRWWKCNRLLLVGLWIPHDNHRSIYALPAERTSLLLRVCRLKAALWGVAPSSLVSHFSGCHISSQNLRPDLCCQKRGCETVTYLLLPVLSSLFTFRGLKWIWRERGHGVGFFFSSSVKQCCRSGQKMCPLCLYVKKTPTRCISISPTN